MGVPEDSKPSLPASSLQSSAYQHVCVVAFNYSNQHTASFAQQSVGWPGTSRLVYCPEPVAAGLQQRLQAAMPTLVMMGVIDAADLHLQSRCTNLFLSVLLSPQS